MKKEDKPYCTFSYKHYRRHKPLIRKEKNLMKIHKWLFWFTILCSTIGIISGDNLPKKFTTYLMAITALSVLGLFYLVYLKLKLKKEIDKVTEEIKEEQKSQLK